MRMIDDVPLFWYDSDNGVAERRVPWFKGANRSLWGVSKNELRFHGVMQTRLNDTLNYINNTEGYHVLQNLDGCTVNTDGTIGYIKEYQYNGQPLIYFDWETRKWKSELPEFEGFVEDVFGNYTMMEEVKNELLNECVPHIGELLSLGECTFNRREAPVVKVTQVPIDNGTLRVHCRAYGHYPKDISIVWYKNGQQISEEKMERTTLPLLDLTYLTSLSFNVTSMADDVYTCMVTHSSMLRGFTQDWNISGDFGNLSSTPTGPYVGAVIGICLAVVVVIVIVAFGLVFFAKSRKPWISG
ncbi:major histocompatibility complex class I-related protein 1-like isoform X2 [Ranitomeya variabilis]